MRKRIITWCVIVLVVILTLVYTHKVPVWVSMSNVVSFLVGSVAGWFAKIVYDKMKKTYGERF